MIVGLARSGTTLVQRLASELSGVWVPPETQFWRHAPHLARTFRWPIERSNVDDLVDSIAGLPGLSEFPLERDALRARIAEPAWLWDIFESITQAAVPSGTSVVGEKTPAHYRWALRLLADVDDLRIVGVRRSPSATFASHQNVEWGVKDPVGFATQWRAANQVLHEAARLYPERVLRLEYDDVVEDPAAARAEIATLIGVEPSVKRDPVQQSGVLFDPSETWKERALEAIEPSKPHPVGKTDADAELIDALVGNNPPAAFRERLASSAAQERRLAAMTELPLPMSAESCDRWEQSDTARSTAWRIRASELSAAAGDRETEIDRLRGVNTRLQHQLRERENELVSAHVETARLRTTNQQEAARSRQRESEIRRLNGALAMKQQKIAALESRRALRFANALGRLRGRRRRD